MGKIKQVKINLDYMNSTAMWNNMVVRHELDYGEPKYNLYPKDSDRLIASYSEPDMMFGFLDGLEFSRTDKGPAE